MRKLHCCTPPIIGLWIAMACFVADQLSKSYLLYIYNVPARQPVHVLPFFDLVMVWNRGVSFGMFQGQNLLQVMMLMMLALAITALLLHWLARAESTLLAAALGLVIGGALGNVIDRVWYGAVADFFLLYVGDYHWPAFNIADFGICVGVALLFLDSMLTPHNHKNASKQVE